MALIFGLYKVTKFYYPKNKKTANINPSICFNVHAMQSNPCCVVCMLPHVNWDKP